MAKAKRYEIVFAPATSEHLQQIERKHHSLIREVVDKQLEFEASVETRNRKPLRQPAALDAEWEIRFGPANRFRVLYRIDEENRIVQILAVGEKVRGRLYVGGEEIDL
jgi:mRNA-degrading endonuclease RelE of RelBE toxin-antitoxin system